MFSLYAAIWRVSGGRQIVLILLSIAIAGLAAVPLSFQKDIINELTAGGLKTEVLIRLCTFQTLHEDVPDQHRWHYPALPLPYERLCCLGGTDTSI